MLEDVERGPAMDVEADAEGQTSNISTTFSSLRDTGHPFSFSNDRRPPMVEQSPVSNVATPQQRVGALGSPIRLTPSSTRTTPEPSGSNKRGLDSDANMKVRVVPAPNQLTESTVAVSISFGMINLH